MRARISWKPDKSFHSIDEQARRTQDPVERLRYVRSQLDSGKLPELVPWLPVRILRIAVMTAAASGAALLIWRIH